MLWRRGYLPTCEQVQGNLQDLFEENAFILERYYAISLAFCTEIYGGKQHHLFPPEWEGDMAFYIALQPYFLERLN